MEYKLKMAASDGSAESEVKRIIISVSQGVDMGIQSVEFAGKKAKISDWDKSTYIVNVPPETLTGLLKIKANNAQSKIWTPSLQSFNLQRNMTGIKNSR